MRGLFFVLKSCNPRSAPDRPIPPSAVPRLSLEGLTPDFVKSPNRGHNILHIPLPKLQPFKLPPASLAKYIQGALFSTAEAIRFEFHLFAKGYQMSNLEDHLEDLRHAVRNASFLTTAQAATLATVPTTALSTANVANLSTAQLTALVSTVNGLVSAVSSLALPQ